MDVQIRVEVAVATAILLNVSSVVAIESILSIVIFDLIVAASPWSVLSVGGNSMNAIPAPSITLKESEELAWAA